MSVDIRIGDSRQLLSAIPSGSVHCCVTSPPYFGLRDYGCDGQMGLEATPDEFIAGMVDLFRDVRRTLRDDGTLWLNIGDSYAGSGRGGNPTRESSTLQGSNVSQEASMVKRRGSQLPAGMHEATRQAGGIGRAWVPPPNGLKQKDLIGIPWMLAFALRADGWYLRQEIIWRKLNPMPESVRDRCTKAHESIFLLSKRPQYYFDIDAIAEARSQDEDSSTFRGGCYVAGEIENATMGKRRVPGNKSHKAALAYGAGDEKHRTKAGLSAAALDGFSPVMARGGAIVALVSTLSPKAEADARLIAAAPELLEACQRFMPKGVAIGNGNVPDDLIIPLDVTMGELRKLETAIAKATGIAQGPVQ